MYEEHQEADASAHSETAQKLRRLAGGLRYDLCRRNQLLALADGFERFAGRQTRRNERAAAPGMLKKPGGSLLRRPARPTRDEVRRRGPCKLNTC